MLYCELVLFFYYGLNINVSWRVWSWLRMNAGGMLNTCKSNENKKISNYFFVLVADGWVTRKNLPLGGGKQLETVANTPYAEE